jgi:hypothetical protein
VPIVGADVDQMQVYARATIPATDKVCLWLGANVMLEYTLGKKQSFKKKLKNYISQ